MSKNKALSSDPAPEVEAPSKRARKEQPTENNRALHYLVDVPSRSVKAGYLTKQIEQKRRSEDIRGRHVSWIRRELGLRSEDVVDQFHVYTAPVAFPVPKGQTSWGATAKDGSWYMELTTGKGIVAGMEAMIRARAEKKAEASNKRSIDLVARILEETKDIREKDNLFHLYAAVMHWPRIAIDMEHLFLRIVTNSGPNNKHGVMVRTKHIDLLCALLEAESLFGVPIITKERDIGNYDRHSRLDLSNLIGDLVQALALQERSLVTTFARPLAPSLYYHGGYGNVIKVLIPQIYSLDLTGPNYDGGL